MKKILIVIALALILTGCKSGGYAHVSDEKEVMFSIKGKEFTKADLYDILHENMYDYCHTEMGKIIAELEGCDLEQLEKDADDYVNKLVEQYGEIIINYYGGTDYFKTTYIDSELVSYLFDKYYDHFVEELDSQYKPVKMKTVYFTDLESAEKMKQLIAEGQTYEYAATSAGYTSEPTATIYTVKDSLTTIVKEYGINAEEKGISDIIDATTTTTDTSGNETKTERYYIVEIVETDIKEMKDDFMTYLSNNEYVSTNSILSYFFTLHDVKFYDQKAYELFTSEYPGLK